MNKWMLRMLLAALTAVALVVAGCGDEAATNDGPKKLRVVTTTTMLADLSRQIGGDAVEVTGLMGPGVDPHLYQASAGDVDVMSKADVVVYNGLHLEGKMSDVFENFTKLDKKIFAAGDALTSTHVMEYEHEGVRVEDPHIWFDVKNWQAAAQALTEVFAEADPANADLYRKNYEQYAAELAAADQYVAARALEIPQDSRVLVTAHDAFQYFARAYQFEVRGLQGVSTASEAGTADVSGLADFIAARKIKAIFVESSIPHKTIEAVQEACRARGWDVVIGGELYSDSLGAADEEAGTYIGMVKANVDTIVDALK